MEEKKDGSQPPATVAPPPENSTPPVLQAIPIQNAPVKNDTENSIDNQSIPSNVPSQATDDIKTLNDRDMIKEHLPNLALGKRLHLDNLTPQWSIESQMSQESSDGPHTQSEGTYRSENQSRNSNKSSPGLNTDHSNFNYSQSEIDELYPRNAEWSKPSNDKTLADQVPCNNSRHNSHDELSSSLQEMSISNSENPVPDFFATNNESDLSDIQENVGAPQYPPSIKSPANMQSHSQLLLPTLQVKPLSDTENTSSYTSSSASIPPVPAVQQPPVAPPTSLPPPPGSSSLPPPTNLPPPISSQNPYKLTGPFSHKNMAKSTTPNPPAVQQFPAQLSNTNLTSPSVVNKISQQSRVPLGFSANLETTPDNSERPDQPQVNTFRPLPTQQIPDNLEIAPQNDRNEYLQTAHLSSGNYSENTDFSRNVPPLGLRRMVVGQQESEYTQNLNMAGDEPPPGLARMVPGQQNEIQGVYNQPNDNYLDRHIDGQPMESGGRPYRQAEGQQTSDNYNQPASTRNSERRPIGLDRMVPGESSNDDYSQYQANPYVSSNEQRVVTGVDHEYAMSIEPGLADVREQIMDGSEYTEQAIRNPSRSVIGARESSNDTSPDFSSRADEQQREIVMEGENLQDLSTISSGDLTYSRELVVDGADVSATEIVGDRTEPSEPLDQSLGSSRRQSLNHVHTSGEETSERDRSVKSSPKREKHKSSRDREKEGRYSRGERKNDRDSERRPTRDERRPDRDRKDRDREPAVGRYQS